MNKVLDAGVPFSDALPMMQRSLPGKEDDKIAEILAEKGQQGSKVTAIGRVWSMA